MKATLLSLLVAALAFAPSIPVVAAPSPTTAPIAAAQQATTAAQAPSPTPAALALTDIAPQSQTRVASLAAIEPEGAPDKVADGARDAFRDLTSRADALVYQGVKAPGNGPASSLDTLRDQLAAWKKLQDTLEDQFKAVADRGNELENENRELDETQKLWKTTKTAVEARDSTAPPETRQQVSDVLTAVDAARKRVAARRSAILALQTTLNDVGSRINTGIGKAQAANAEAVKTLLVPDSDPLWMPSGKPRPEFFARWRQSSGDQWVQITAYARAHWDRFALHLGIFIVLLGVMFWVRRLVSKWTEEEPHLARAAPLFQLPFSTALVLSFVVKGNLYAGTPPIFRTCLGVIVVVPTVIILRRLLDRRLGLIVFSLFGFFAADALRLATAEFEATNRWIFCTELLAAAIVFGVLTQRQRTVHATGAASLGRGIFLLNALAILTLLSALGGSVLGYMRLGTLLGEGALYSSYLAVALYAMLRVVEGLVVIMLRVRPATASRVVRQHRAMLQDRIYKTVRFLAIVGWAVFTLDRFQVLIPLYDAVTRILDFKLPLGAVDDLTPGRILAFGVALWLSRLVSRFVRFLLDEEVYERVQLSAGLPYAITTILNYTILIVGGFVALGVLGVPLSKFTIVAGAFSVGLGFGLQNIINNFVSGVILLFERPIKVGDIIQIGDATGEVRRIGIRASIVRTRDGADVILPNGNLISNQVINWTYADRARAVEIPLNLAPGGDYERAVELLRTTAQEFGKTGDRAQPEVFITALAAAGPSVIVRAWTDHYEDWQKVRSDLSAALGTALARENIKLA